MRNRILAFVILWTVLIATSLMLGYFGAYALLALAAAGTFRELARLLEAMHQPADRWLSGCIIALLLGLGMLLPATSLPPSTLVAGAFALTLAGSLLRSDIGAITATLQRNLLLVFGAGLPFFCALLILQQFDQNDSGLFLCVWIIAVAKFTDVGALLTGTWLGRHRLAPLLSPKKTWEGLAGGLLFAMIVSVSIVALSRNHLPPALTPIRAAWMAIPIASASVIADLLESAIKREASVKDSGRIIPGIGGVFDLTDSLLLAFPVGYVLLSWTY